jgi:hypothetical protein
MLSQQLLTAYSVLFLSLLLIAPVKAQDYISPDEYYKPVTKRDLDYNSKTLTNKSGSFANGAGLNSFNSGCPDEINIGGIGNNTRVIGSVDIDINIDENFRINCGGR